MEFGQLNTRITFNKKAQKKDSNGELKDVLVPSFSCWAEVRRASAKEFKEAEGRSTKITFAVREQQSKKIETNMVITFGSGNFEVKETLPDYKYKELFLIKGELFEW
ncbi:phage head closure protein [Listeria booriae]|uniref:Phage head closure protein n=1 Tax=Listeria booriae TaxID=1552123 RepID=A0A841YP41_9LIST|nr:phage head closure protein [Listeria booriae]MBC1402139.1 phage head closure protein [Listeria booriae]MBC1617871.1 phage head closure protein [Listeria booriae]